MTSFHLHAPSHVLTCFRGSVTRSELPQSHQDAGGRRKGGILSLLCASSLSTASRLHSSVLSCHVMKTTITLGFGGHGGGTEDIQLALQPQ